jgi:hypothetical protein
VLRLNGGYGAQHGEAANVVAPDELRMLDPVAQTGRFRSACRRAFDGVQSFPDRSITYGMHG